MILHFILQILAVLSTTAWAFFLAVTADAFLVEREARRRERILVGIALLTLYAINLYVIVAA